MLGSNWPIPLGGAGCWGSTYAIMVRASGLMEWTLGEFSTNYKMNRLITLITLILCDCEKYWLLSGFSRTEKKAGFPGRGRKEIDRLLQQSEFFIRGCWFFSQSYGSASLETIGYSPSFPLTTLPSTAV